ncbi:cyclin-sds [Phtheirospermum japonicum]|uniref:Cyclin-sds n=1 Tax=Phtheirospermum japonicum TaxID=374723 RepID=A0A830BEM0_9LAMI|nr:cyclin-sds [Phtheirospermum japonicum]
MKRKLNPRAVLEIEASSAEEQSLYFTKKQRSKLSRRRRLHISPIVQLPGSDSHLTALSEVSCDSSIASVCNPNPPESRNEFRRAITRSYYRKKFKNESRNFDQALELSDNSCVDSCSGANRELKLKNRDVKELEIEGGEVTKSEVSSGPRRLISKIGVQKVKENESRIYDQTVEKFFRGEITNSEAEKENSLISGAESVHSDEKTIRIGEKRAASEDQQLPELVALDIDLACSEQFSNGGAINGWEDEEEEYSSSASEVYHVVSDSEFASSEYTPSIWSYESGSQFSEKSMADESSSPTFELFRQFKEQFCSSTTVLKAFDDQNSHPIIVLGLEDEEDEESYRMLRKRERRQEYVRDYAEEYCLTTAYGDLVIQQRLHMVHWIVEEATNKELQKETMFLGVNLFDRFLSKGYFKNVRNLQIAGIACLALATRIEENQPYNCIRKKTFNVGSTIYARCEVVAMEWLVQEVLNFQCYLPTLYNFLWFYLKAARAKEIMEKTTKYLAVLTLMGHQQLCYWPSTVAAGLVILASIATNQDASCRLITSVGIYSLSIVHFFIKKYFGLITKLPMMFCLIT